MTTYIAEARITENALVLIKFGLTFMYCDNKSTWSNKSIWVKANDISPVSGPPEPIIKRKFYFSYDPEKYPTHKAIGTCRIDVDTFQADMVEKLGKVTLPAEKPDDIFVPNLSKYLCPICGHEPQLHLSSLDKDSNCLPQDTVALRIKCTYPGCVGMGFSYHPKDWVKMYSAIEKRWKT